MPEITVNILQKVMVKPCPFCGSESIRRKDGLVGYYLGCEDCGATSSIRSKNLKNSPTNMLEIIERWNNLKR